MVSSPWYGIKTKQAIQTACESDQKIYSGVAATILKYPADKKYKIDLVKECVSIKKDVVSGT